MSIMSKDEQVNKKDKFYDYALQTIGAVAKFPIIRVDRKAFLSKQFGESKYLDKILESGPQAVFTPEALRKKATKVIKSCTYKTSVASFIAGLPSNPVLMVAAGGADVTQYVGFAVNMAQQIAYLFGEDDLFDGDSNDISEIAKIRIVAYLGGMFGVAGAANLIFTTSKAAAANIGKKVANQALMKTAWYPLFKRLAALVGVKITKKSVETIITKTVPIAGGVISGAITYATFIPMGNRLADTFVKNLKGEFDEEELELNPDFIASLSENDIINVDEYDT